jgi:hypothetical protein
MRKSVWPSPISAAFIGLLAITLLAGPVLAQETDGSLAGKVLGDTDGEPLPGVTVIARSDDTGGELVQVTDGQGRYRFLNLPVGSYTVTASLDGFQTLEQDMVRVNLGQTTTVNMALPAGDLAETITVTSESPLIDVSSTVSGINVNMDETYERVPITREITQVAMLAPGTTGGDTAFNSSSRAYTPGQNLISVGGSSVGENTYVFNGLNLTNFRNGLGSSNVPFEFVKEVQVKTGGYEAEFGRSTGGVLNMVSRSGSNAFHGGISLYHSPSSLQEQSPDYFNGLNSEEERESTEVNLTVGGPIYRDKAFFFAMYQDNDFESTGVGTTRETLRVRDDPYYGGKLDINLTPSHRLEGTYFRDIVTVDSTEFNFDPAARVRQDLVGSGTHDAGGENIIGKYTGIFGSSVVFSGQYGENEFERTVLSSGDAFPAIWDSRGASTTFPGQWVNIQVANANDTRDATRADLDFFVSNHSVRLGLDDEQNTSGDLTTYSGPSAEFPGGEYYRYFKGDPSRHPSVSADDDVVRFRQFAGGGSFDVESSAIYVQDSWEITPTVLANFGGRWESFDNKNALGESFIKKDNQFAPRVGVVWDPSGDGNQKVYANVGRYHLYIASNTNVRMAGAETFTEDWYTMAAGCDTENPTTTTCLGRLLEANVFGDGEVPDVRLTKSNSIDPMYQDELLIGYEKMLGTKWSVGARGVYRIMDQAIEDITIDAAMTEQGLPGFGAFEYRLVNPGSSFDGYVDLHDGTPIFPFSASAAELGYPEPERNNYAIDLTFNRRYADNWMLQGSLTWAHSYGNYEGYVRSDNGQDDAGITTLYDFAGLMDQTYGNLPNDRRWNFKTFGAYQWDNGFMLGSSLTYREGRPLNAFGVHPTDDFAALYGNESLFDQGTPVPRGSRGNTDALLNIDLTAKYDFNLNGPWGLALRADVFNIFDEDTVTEVDEGADEESGAINTTYLQGTRFQRPRGVRFNLVLRR